MNSAMFSQDWSLNYDEISAFSEEKFILEDHP